MERAAFCAVDIRNDSLEQGRRLAEKYGVQDRVQFTDSPTGLFDGAISLCAFEHFRSPEMELAQMASFVKTEGLVVISFPKPWYSHAGSHMNDFFHIPGLTFCFR